MEGENLWKGNYRDGSSKRIVKSICTAMNGCKWGRAGARLAYPWADPNTQAF